MEREIAEMVWKGRWITDSRQKTAEKYSKPLTGKIEVYL
jgi:hypothetical protein